MKSQPAIVAKNQSFRKRELSADTLSDRLLSSSLFSPRFLLPTAPCSPFFHLSCRVSSLSLSFLPYPISTQPHPLVVNLTPPPFSSSERYDQCWKFKVRFARRKMDRSQYRGRFDRKSSPVSPVSAREWHETERRVASPRLAAYKITEEVANHRSGRVLRGITRVFAPSVINRRDFKRQMLLTRPSLSFPCPWCRREGPRETRRRSHR